SYAEGVIDKTEFEPRIAGLKQRMSQMQARHQAAHEAAETERDLALVVSRLEDFSAKVITGLDHLDRLGMRDIIRTVVRRIEINDSRIEVVFRVPSPGDSPGPGSSTKMTGSWQHCTSVGRTYTRLVEPLPPTGQGLGEPQSQRSRFPQTRFHPPHVAKAMQSLMKSPDGLLADRGLNCSHSIGSRGEFLSRGKPRFCRAPRRRSQPLSCGRVM